MICTLRITHKNFPPMRSTLDLYTDTQTDKLIRTLCDKYGLTLMEVSKSVHACICQLESYKLERLRYPQGDREKAFEMSREEEQAARKYLSDKNLIGNLQKDLRHIGILGEDDNALILFLAMASHKSDNPFSVLCLAKSGIGKSYLLNKLSDCMPKNCYSFHTQISENALYYFDSTQIDGKVLFVEDLEWTAQMLIPLATLQTQGRLTKTRATKNKDGMLHSTTFEVSGKLCLIACACSEQDCEQLNLPFLCLHLNHSHTQDINVMEYQKKCKAGLINQTEISQTQRKLQCVIASLKPANIINPFAPLINLPDDLPHPRKTLLLLLNFIDAITFFRQYQRKEEADQSTGEVLIKTHPEDIELAFALLKNSLFRRADELSTTARGFYNWLKKYLSQAKTKQFTALDVRKVKRIHPRTLNRYLQELCLFHYIQVAGGNKYREGYQYKITNMGDEGGLNLGIENALRHTLETIKTEHEKQHCGTASVPRQERQNETSVADNTIPQTEPKAKRTWTKTSEKEERTFKLLLELEAQQPQRTYLPEDFTVVTERSLTTEAKYLKVLWEQGKLTREWRNGQFYYALATESSRTVGQTTLSDTQTADIKEKNSKTTTKIKNNDDANT